MDLPWRFELLGGLRAQRGSLVFTRCATSRVTSLLARLCLFPGRSHLREELVGLLWPDGDPDAARNSLRVAISSLRRQLEPPGVAPGSILLADRTSIRFNPAACRSDVADFKAALAKAARSSVPQEQQEALGHALRLFTGELLPGVYDEWIVEEREQLNALYEDALYRHSGLRIGASEFLPVTSQTDAKELRLYGFPPQHTRFFGREADGDAAVAMLTAAGTRLLTLTGPGGAGKTRLAVEIAHAAAPAFSGAVRWVSLADLPQASLIPDAIARVLGLTGTSAPDPLAQIAESLAVQPPSLLVLDNFEHLVDAGAPLLYSLLSRVPHLTCLVTSRRRLALPGEREQVVPPLPLPSTQGTLEQIALFASVQLFVDRSQAARPDFQLTHSNMSSVAELCRSLEGIPLALELVAARALALTPLQMTERLSSRFSLPAGWRGDKGGRHSSLWAAMAWSYGLISPPLQRFFSGLSVFRGGWTVEAAGAVCDEPAALEYLSQLRERSLVMTEDGPSGVRFRLLETLREYALNRLQESGAEGALRTRHRDYFLALAEEVEPKLVGKGAAEWIAFLGPERENLRTALSESLARHGLDETQIGLRLTGALGRFWQMRGELTEGREQISAALSRPGAEEPTSARAWALRWAGVLANYQGDYAAAHARCEEALALFRTLRDARGSGWALTILGIVAANWGDAQNARARFAEALAFFRVADDASGIGGTLNNLGSLLMDEGDLDSAKPYYEEALVMLQKADNKPGAAIMLTNLGTLAYYQDKFPQARRYLEQSLALRTEAGSRGDQSTYALVILAAVSLCEGKRTEARSHLTEGLIASRQSGDKASAVNLLEFAGRLCFAEGNAFEAARAVGAASKLRTETGIMLDIVEQPKYQATLAEVRAALSQPIFEAAWIAGADLTWEEAVDEVCNTGS